jgi:hypothetical protein
VDDNIEEDPEEEADKNAALGCEGLRQVPSRDDAAPIDTRVDKGAGTGRPKEPSHG